MEKKNGVSLGRDSFLNIHRKNVTFMQGPDGGISASKYCYIGGFDATRYYQLYNFDSCLFGTVIGRTC